MSVTGTAAIVFGGARGIGAACVERLLDEGAKVCLADINNELGESLCSRLQTSHPDRVMFRFCDITEEQQLEDVFNATTEAFGSVEICVSTPGLIDEVNWRKMLRLNLEGNICVQHIAEKRMAKNNGHKGGVVILMASILGLIAVPTTPCYTASKHALVGFVRSLKDDPTFTKHGVRTNVICPNLVSTEMLDESVYDNSKFSKEDIDNILASWRATALKPEAVGDAMMKLVLEEEHNGSCMIFTKEGIMAYNEEDRTKKIMEMLP